MTKSKGPGDTWVDMRYPWARSAEGASPKIEGPAVLALYESVDQSKPREQWKFSIHELEVWPKPPLPEKYVGWRRELEEHRVRMESLELKMRLFSAWWIVYGILWGAWLLLAWSTGVFSQPGGVWPLLTAIWSLMMSALGLRDAGVVFRHIDAWAPLHAEAVRSLDEADQAFIASWFAKFPSAGATYTHVGGSRLPGGGA